MDIFSLPEMTLLSCVNDFFMSHNIDYEPVHLYKDVKVSYLDSFKYFTYVFRELCAQYLQGPSCFPCFVSTRCENRNCSVFIYLQCAALLHPFCAVLILALKNRCLILVNKRASSHLRVFSGGSTASEGQRKRGQGNECRLLLLF